MPENSSVFRSAFSGLLICFAILFVGAVGFSIGKLVSELQAYRKQYEYESALIEPFLASDPAFKDIKCHQRSNGGVDLSGGVPKQADLDRLREGIIRFVGERRAEEMTCRIQVFAER